MGEGIRYSCDGLPVEVKKYGASSKDRSFDDAPHRRSEIIGFMDAISIVWVSLLVIFNINKQVGERALSAIGRAELHKYRQSERSPTFVGDLSMVGVPGLEPGASWSRTKRATKLRYTPMLCRNISNGRLSVYLIFCLSSSLSLRSSMANSKKKRNRQKSERVEA